MKKLSMLLMLAAFLVSSCETREKSESASQKVVIAGVVKNLSEGNVGFKLDDNNEKVNLNQEGYFHFSTQISHPVYIKIGLPKVKGFTYPRDIFCVPGDSIFVTYSTDAEKIQDQVIYTGSHSKENNFLVKKLDYFQQMPVVGLVRRLTFPNDSIGYFLDNELKNYEGLLDEISHKDYCPDFVAFEKFQVLNLKLQEKTSYKFVKRMYNNNPQVKASVDSKGKLEGKVDTVFSDKYFEFAKNVDLNNRMFYQMNPGDYLNAVELAVNFLPPRFEGVKKSTPEEKKAYYTAYYGKFAKYIKDPVILDRKYYDLFNGFLSRQQVDVVEPYVDLIKDPEKRKEINEKISKLTSLNNIAFPDFTAETVDGKTITPKDLQGKYTYIDFWATWCGPCKAQIPYLKKLEEKFRSRNVNFLSLSIDQEKDMEKWKNMVAEKEMKGIQAHITPEVYDPIRVELKILGIPRFILLDPKGVIINFSAPRPSSTDEITAILDALPGM